MDAGEKIPEEKESGGEEISTPQTPKWLVIAGSIGWVAAVASLIWENIAL